MSSLENIVPTEQHHWENVESKQIKIIRVPQYCIE